MVRPSPYSHTDSAEQDAITALYSLLDSRFVKPDIRIRDKYPNIDGTLELVDEQQVPMGKLDIQVRKIRPGATRYSSPASLVAYSQVSTLPVILICVDPTKQVAFWRQISPLMPEYKVGQHSYTIHFTKAADAIDEDGVYLQKWMEIVRDYRERIANYPKLRTEVASKHRLNGIEPKDLEVFQRFIETVNDLLDNDFIAVKKLLFPGVWKLGVGVFSAGSHSFTYQLYRIPYKENLPLVCRLEGGSLISEDVNPTAIGDYQLSRATLASPEKAGRKFVLGCVKRTIAERALPIHGGLMAFDTLITFVDEYSSCLNLVPNQDNYLVSDLDYALNRHLLAICEAIATKISKPGSRYLPLDLDWVSRYLFDNPLEPVVQEGTHIFISLSSKRFPLAVIFDALRYLVGNNIKSATRPFARRNVPVQKGDNWVWSGYTRQDEIQSVNRILNDCLVEYSAFVAGNQLRFPQSVYLDKDTAVWFEYEPTSSIKEWPGPIIREHHIDNHLRQLPKLTASILEQVDNGIDFAMFPDVVEIEGEQYRALSTSRYAASFLFDRTPVANLIYRMLLKDLGDHYEFDEIDLLF